FLDPRLTPELAPMAHGLAALVPADAAEMRRTEHVCFFPMALAGSDRVCQLPNGVWWVPSGAPARLLRYGDSIIGYDIDRPLGDAPAFPRASVLWSTDGKQEATFWIDPQKPVQFYDSLGAPLKLKSKRG